MPNSLVNTMGCDSQVTKLYMLKFPILKKLPYSTKLGRRKLWQIWNYKKIGGEILTADHTDNSSILTFGG